MEKDLPRPSETATRSLKRPSFGQINRSAVMAVLSLLLEACGLLGFTWWLLARYREAQVSTVGLGAVFLSWTLGFAGLLLLPIDMARHGQWLVNDDDEEDEDPERASDLPGFLTAWQALYWLTFLLSWLVLPLLVEFSQHGEFRVGRRLLGALNRLVLHWTIVVAVVVAAVVYLVFVGHFTALGLVGLAMASANTYGLAWLIVLLGYGLADIPRTLWTQRDPEKRLRALHFRATQVHHERMEAIFLYQDVLRDVRVAYNRLLQAEGASIILTSDMQDVKAGLLTVLALMDTDGRPPQPTGSAYRQKTTTASPMLMTSTLNMPSAPPSYSAVVELHRRVKAAQADLRGTEQAWVELCLRADALQRQLPPSRHTALPPVGLYSTTNLLAQLGGLTATAASEAQRLVLPTLWALGALVASLASLCVLWGELTMGWGIASLSLVHVLSLAGAGGLELAAFALLLYMVVCAYASLFKLRSFGRFALRGHGNSSELALLKTAIHQCRLQFALSYNFVLLLDAPALTEATAFHRLWHSMRVIRVLGRDLSVLAPALMVALVACTLTNVYARVMKQLVGMEQYEQLLPGDADHEAQVAKGEQLLRKARDKMRRRSEQAARKEAAAMDGTAAMAGAGMAVGDTGVQWRGRGMQAPQEMAASLLPAAYVPGHEDHSDDVYDDEEEEERFGQERVGVA